MGPEPWKLEVIEMEWCWDLERNKSDHGRWYLFGTGYVIPEVLSWYMALPFGKASQAYLGTVTKLFQQQHRFPGHCCCFIKDKLEPATSFPSSKIGKNLPESPRKDHLDQAAHWIVPAQQGQDFAGWNPGGHGGADFLPVGGCMQQLWICRKQT